MDSGTFAPSAVSPDPAVVDPLLAPRPPDVVGPTAVVSGAFQSRLDAVINAKALSPRAQAAVAAARSKPLVTDASGVPSAQRGAVHAALVDASVYAFRIGMGVGGGLAILGGVVALIGIENPRRRVRCADCPPAAVSTTGASLATEQQGVAPEPAGARW